MSAIMEKPDQEDQTVIDKTATHEVTSITSDISAQKLKQVKEQRFEVASEFWGRIDGPAVIMVINLNGVSFIDQADRKNIFHHVEFEDILYVMGKGNTLKLGFRLYQDKSPKEEYSDESDGQTKIENFTTDDLRTILHCNALPGFKARVIAEDIISYA